MLEQLIGRSLVKSGYRRLLALGSILGVAAVIVVQALFASYYRAVEQHLLGLHPHLSLRAETIDAAGRAVWEEALARHGEEVVGVNPAIDLVVSSVVSAVKSHSVVCVDEEEGAACFDFLGGGEVPAERLRDAQGFEVMKRRVGRLRLRGIAVDGASAEGVRRIMDVRAGHDDLRRLEQGPEEGMPMACLFDRTFFHGASRLDEFLVALPAIDEEPGHLFRLLSTVNLGMRRTEHPVFVTSLASARRLLARPGFTNVLEVELRDPRTAPELARALAGAAEVLGGRVETWQDQDAGSFRLLEVLRQVIFTVVFSVVVIAGLAIGSTLSLVVLEGRRKIAMLKALGLRHRTLYTALILKCWQIAALSLAAGTALGLVASESLLKLPGFRQGLGKMGITDPQVLVQGSDLALLAAATFLLYLVVALLPARQACRIDAVEGLQS